MLGNRYGMLVNVQGWNLIEYFFSRNKNWFRFRFCSFNRERSKYFPIVRNWRNELILDELVKCSDVMILAPFLPKNLSLCDVPAPMLQYPLCNGNEERLRRSLYPVLIHLEIRGKWHPPQYFHQVCVFSSVAEFWFWTFSDSKFEQSF